MLAAAAAFAFAAAAPAAEGELAALKARLAPRLPEISLDSLRPSSALAGWYELEIGLRLVYVSPDGSRLLAGDVIDLASHENLTRAWRRRTALALIEAVGEEHMIVLGPAHPRHTITVFTDVDCPYCARLHRDVPALTQAGVKVRYLLYPRAGIGSRTYRRSVAVWCASDRARAFGLAKGGGEIEMKTCPNPVAQHYALGRRLEIRGTPTIFLDDGRRIGGYVPPARLLALLADRAPGAAADAR